MTLAHHTAPNSQFGYIKMTNYLSSRPRSNLSHIIWSMRQPIFAIFVMLAIGTACSSDDEGPQSTSSSALSASAASTPETASTSAAASTPAEIANTSLPTGDVTSLSTLVCVDEPVRMSPDAEKYTEESWTCTGTDDDLRIDIYRNSEQQVSAAVALTDFYRSLGDERALSELPLICGDLWGIGTNYNETRDELITQLNEAGFAASTC